MAQDKIVSTVTNTQESGTLKGLLRQLMGDNTRRPEWPPDVYAVAATVLRQTGAYVRVAELTSPLLPTAWHLLAAQLGKEWRSALNAGTTPQSENWNDYVESSWGILVGNSSIKLSALRNDDELCRALLQLVGIADEASYSIGVYGNQESRDKFLIDADVALTSKGFLSVCKDISTDCARVLPKCHTPQRGLTLRSLTHHLALIPAAEATAKWSPKVEPENIESRLNILNVLVLPWPLEIPHACFSIVDTSGKEHHRLPPKYQYFQFKRHSQLETFSTYLRNALCKARKLAEDIDAIILPEMSLTYEELEHALEVARQQGVILITGAQFEPGDNAPQRLRRWAEGKIGDRRDDSQSNDRIDEQRANDPSNAPDTSTDTSQDRVVNPPNEHQGEHNGPVNAAVLDFAGFWEKQRVESSGLSGAELRKIHWQSKHHRWCLDWKQIVQYQLETRLPASDDCWEYIDIGARVAQFFNIGEWLSFGVLICEDLARQDPISDLVRTVAPNLIIALLMDGPQLRGRWGAKYASVLSEDPGCSVLTVTSLGMSKLSQPRQPRTLVPSKIVSRHNVIALWNDLESGECEIELEDGDNAVLLSIVDKTHQEWTADGRPDGYRAHSPTLVNYRSFYAHAAKEEHDDALECEDN